MSVGLFIVRLVVGVTLAAHGAQKLLGWFGGGGIRGTAPLMEQIGFRPGRVHAVLAGLAELGGGLLLAAGLLTPAAVAVVVAVMFVAGASVHASKGFFAHQGGFEYTLVLGGVAAGLGFSGPGALSLDHALGLGWSGDAWGLAALALGLAGGGASLIGRTRTATATVHKAA
jgi:putative oxidoreductase